MSNIPTPSHQLSPPQLVILKGFECEPIQVLAVADRSDAIEVASNPNDEPMPFHADSVFKFDAQLYADLLHAAERDRESLGKTWARAIPFRSSTVAQSHGQHA